MELDSRHIPLKLDLSKGLAVLSELGGNVTEDIEPEHCFRVNTSKFGVAIYPRDGVIESVWYDDPLGRNFDGGIDEKIRLYLDRYGDQRNWVLRMDNGWMRYWFNPRDKAAMVYGIHNDVIRFNYYGGE